MQESPPTCCASPSATGVMFCRHPCVVSVLVMTRRHCLGVVVVLLIQWGYPFQKRLKSDGYQLKDVLVSFYMAHDPSCLFIKRFEINQPICLGSGLSVDAKEKKMCHSVLVSSCYFHRGDCCVAVEECDGPLEISLWASTSLCHCLMNL